MLSVRDYHLQVKDEVSKATKDFFAPIKWLFHAIKNINKLPEVFVSNTKLETDLDKVFKTINGLEADLAEQRKQLQFQSSINENLQSKLDEANKALSDSELFCAGLRQSLVDVNNKADVYQATIDHLMERLQDDRGESFVAFKPVYTICSTSIASSSSTIKDSK